MATRGKVALQSPTNPETAMATEPMPVKELSEIVAAYGGVIAMLADLMIASGQIDEKTLVERMGLIHDVWAETSPVAAGEISKLTAQLRHSRF